MPSSSPPLGFHAHLPLAGILQGATGFPVEIAGLVFAYHPTFAPSHPDHPPPRRAFCACRRWRGGQALHLPCPYFPCLALLLCVCVLLPVTALSWTVQGLSCAQAVGATWSPARSGDFWASVAPWQCQVSSVTPPTTSMRLALVSALARIAVGLTVILVSNVLVPWCTFSCYVWSRRMCPSLHPPNPGDEVGVARALTALVTFADRLASLQEDSHDPQDNDNGGDLVASLASSPSSSSSSSSSSYPASTITPRHAPCCRLGWRCVFGRCASRSFCVGVCACVLHALTQGSWLVVFLTYQCQPAARAPSSSLYSCTSDTLLVARSLSAVTASLLTTLACYHIVAHAYRARTGRTLSSWCARTCVRILAICFCFRHRVWYCWCRDRDRSRETRARLYAAVLVMWVIGVFASVLLIASVACLTRLATFGSNHDTLLCKDRVSAITLAVLSASLLSLPAGISVRFALAAHAGMRQRDRRARERRERSTPRKCACGCLSDLLSLGAVRVSLLVLGIHTLIGGWVSLTLGILCMGTGRVATCGGSMGSSQAMMGVGSVMALLEWLAIVYR